MNDLKRHVLIKQFFCFCLFLSGLGLWGYANAKTHCQVTVTYYAGEPGNASGVVIPPTPKNPICKRKVPLRVSSNTVAWDIHHV
jgi:hypothetical protein